MFILGDIFGWNELMWHSRLSADTGMGVGVDAVEFALHETVVGITCE